MTPKFTKGPWKVADANVKTESDVGVHGRDYIICDMCRDGYDDDEQEANAALIAAAPELYDALEAILNRYVQLANSGDAGNWDPEEEDAVISSRAAIHKATSIVHQ